MCAIGIVKNRAGVVWEEVVVVHGQPSCDVHTVELV